MFKQYTLLFFLTMLSGSCIAMESTAQDARSDEKKDTSLTVDEANQNALTEFHHFPDLPRDMLPIMISYIIQCEALQAQNLKHLHKTISKLRLVSPSFSTYLTRAFRDKERLESVLSAYIGNAQVSHLSDDLFSPERKTLIVDYLMPIMQKKGADLNELERRVVTLFTDHQNAVATQPENANPIDFEPTRLQLFGFIVPAFKSDDFPLMQLSVSSARTDTEIEPVLGIIESRIRRKKNDSEDYTVLLETLPGFLEQLFGINATLQAIETDKAKSLRLCENMLPRMQDQDRAASIRSKMFLIVNPDEKELLSGNRFEVYFKNVVGPFHYRNSSEMILQALSNAHILPINKTLWQATFNGDTTTVEQVVTSNEFASQDDTPLVISIALFFAISKGHKACVLLLLNHNPDTNILVRHCISAAAISGDTSIIDPIVQTVPFAVESVKNFVFVLPQFMDNSTNTSHISKNAKKIAVQAICRKFQSVDPTFTNAHIQLILNCMENNDGFSYNPIQYGIRLIRYLGFMSDSQATEQIRFLITQVEPNKIAIEFAIIALIINGKQDLIEFFLRQEHLPWTLEQLNSLATVAEAVNRKTLAKLLRDKIKALQNR